MKTAGSPVGRRRSDAWLQQAQTTWRSMLSWSSTTSSAPTPTAPTIRRASVLTNENQRTNDPWGDQLTEKPSDCTRIHIQNVNGFSLDRRGGQFDQFCSIHTEIQADVSCGQEHKLDTTQMHIRSILYDTAKNHWERSKIIFGTTPIPFSSNYKPGGTFMVSTGSVTGRIRKQHRDKWGRWVAQEFSGRNSSTVMIISAYQPVNKRNKEGTNSVASQHRSLLLQTGDQTDDPRTAFRRDLLQQLQQYRQEGIEFLLVGDFNEAYGTDPDGISSIAGVLGLIHLMSHRHPHQPAPVTYARGVKCLDYALGTPQVAEAVVAVGYEAFNERFISDHRGYFLDFKTNILFGSPTQDLAAHTRRTLCSSNPKQNTAYIE
jgi:exonuclease III